MQTLYTFTSSMNSLAGLSSLIPTHFYCTWCPFDACLSLSVQAHFLGCFDGFFSIIVAHMISCWGFYIRNRSVWHCILVCVGHSWNNGEKVVSLNGFTEGVKKIWCEICPFNTTDSDCHHAGFHWRVLASCHIKKIKCRGRQWITSSSVALWAKS